MQSGAQTVNRLGAMLLLNLMLVTTPAWAQLPGQAVADQVAQALTACNDGMHAIEEADVDRHSISFRAGPREVRVFFGTLSVDYAEVGSAGRKHRREARLMLACARNVECVLSGAWTAEMAAARSEHGIVLLSALPIRQQSIALYCPDLAAAQALRQALLALRRPVAH
jgi:hypothetical protein